MKTKKSSFGTRVPNEDCACCVKRSKVLDLDLHFNTTGQLELHQRVNSLGSRAVDVDETLVGRNLELLTALLVNEGRAVYSDDALAGGKGDRTANYGTSSLHVLHDLLS